jgi:2-oxoisovalerate dehydrogenase E1 component
MKVAGSGWTRSQWLHFYELMLTSRLLDDEEIRLRKRNEVFFQVSGAGHEAISLAAGYWLKPGYDWFFCHYRDRALMLHLGLTPYEMLLSAVGAREDPVSAGRQMPCHWGLKRANVVSRSSSVGTQFHQAVGCALAGRYIQGSQLPLPAASDEIVLCTAGEGTTCQGEFFEALNFACLRRLRVLFVIEDNGYAISVPAADSIAGGSVSALVAGFPGLTILELDGSDLGTSLEVMQKAVKQLREGESGPVLVHAHVTRPYSHSLSDDQAAYRPASELAAEQQRDCIRRLEEKLVGESLSTREDLQAIRKRVRGQLADAVARSLAAAKPDPASALEHLYSNVALVRDEPPPPTIGEAVTMAQAINATLDTEMRRDPRILVFGEDVADASREEILGECKGKGGVFKITYGLQARHGIARVFNSPLAEAGIIGRAIGLAVRGLRPVPEIQFFDFIWPAMSQLRNELATLRYRSGGQFSAPMVIRAPIGGYLRGGAMFHSQTGEAIFAKCPGLQMVYPSTAADAAGLLRSALRGEDPVLFLEPKHLYYQAYARSPMPDSEYTIPLGLAAIRRTGDDITLVTWGNLVQRSLEAAAQLEHEEGIGVEVIDLRSLVPLDGETIFESVRRTGRCLVASEEGRFAGFGAEIASQIQESCFEWLDAPVQRLGSLDTWVAYSPVLEEATLPQVKDIAALLRHLALY